jgi:hypothetical protein
MKEMLGKPGKKQPIGLIVIFQLATPVMQVPSSLEREAQLIATGRLTLHWAD